MHFVSKCFFHPFRICVLSTTAYFVRVFYTMSFVHIFPLCLSSSSSSRLSSPISLAYLISVFPPCHSSPSFLRIPRPPPDADRLLTPQLHTLGGPQPVRHPPRTHHLHDAGRLLLRLLLLVHRPIPRTAHRRVSEHRLFVVIGGRCHLVSLFCLTVT